MALIKCPKCGRQFSTHANKCPHCGCTSEEVRFLLVEQRDRRKKEERDCWIILSIGLLLFAIIMAVIFIL